MISLNPTHLKRYRDIASLLIKYGHSDLVKKMKSDFPDMGDAVNDSDEARGRAGEFARDLENLGPTYIKLGQLLSTQSAWTPEAYIKALEELQDKVDPFPFEEVEKVIASELGAPLKKIF